MVALSPLHAFAAASASSGAACAQKLSLRAQGKLTALSSAAAAPLISTAGPGGGGGGGLGAGQRHGVGKKLSLQSERGLGSRRLGRRALLFTATSVLGLFRRGWGSMAPVS